MSAITKIFGTHSERELKRIYPLVDKVESYREAMGALSDEELKNKTKEYKERLENGETPVSYTHLYNIEEAKIIVTGYGCCGRAVAARLKALGARVTVLARRREVRKLAKKDGFYAADFAFGPEEAMGAAMLVNTVPAPVVTGAIIRELRCV